MDKVTLYFRAYMEAIILNKFYSCHIPVGGNVFSKMLGALAGLIFIRYTL